VRREYVCVFSIVDADKAESACVEHRVQF
jgi:hypothetical protein